MTELVILLVAAALVALAVRRRAAQRAGAAPGTVTAGIPCMIKREADGNRWRAGRLLVGDGPPMWQPRPARRGEPAALPAGLRRTGLRSPSVREGITINPGSTVVECEAAEGTVLIAVMPLDRPLVERTVPPA